MRPQECSALPSMREHARLWEIATCYGGARLLRATYVRQSFARHAHEDFPIGVIERGALAFEYRGEHLVAPAGAINLANPGEPHTGQAALASGWTYRMVYVEVEVLRAIASELAGRPRDIPFFRAGVLDDADLARRLHALHAALERADAPGVEQETRLFALLGRVIVGHADDRPSVKPAGREHQAVKRAREYLDAYYAESITLADLAGAAGLSPYYLARAFTAELGLPPHAYLTQVRIRRAQALLKRDCPITGIAYDVGFSDQSHLNRRFKRIVGLTPGQYRKNIQDR
jgi:AraC-like DNA-binding protein